MAAAVEAQSGEGRLWESLTVPAGIRIATTADPQLPELIESHPGPLLVVDPRCPEGLFEPGRPPRGWAPPDLPEAQARRLVRLLAEGLSVCYASVPPAASRARPPAALPGQDSGPGRDSGPRGLTPREREVLDLVSEGWSNAEIAGVLDISVHTVKYHLARLLERLEAANRAELVRRAAELGLLRL